MIRAALPAALAAGRRRHAANAKMKAAAAPSERINGSTGVRIPGGRAATGSGAAVPASVRGGSAPRDPRERGIEAREAPAGTGTSGDTLAGRPAARTTPPVCSTAREVMPRASVRALPASAALGAVSAPPAGTLRSLPSRARPCAGADAKGTGGEGAAGGGAGGVTPTFGAGGAGGSAGGAGAGGSPRGSGGPTGAGSVRGRRSIGST